MFSCLCVCRYNLLAERETKAAVYCLAGIAGRIAAGNGHKVQIYKLLTRDDGNNNSSIGAGMIVSELQLECSIAEHILVLFLRVVPHAEYHYLIAGDLHRSITLLQYKPVEASIEEVARDFNTNMMRSLESLPALPGHFLGADDQMNLFMVKHRATAETEEERSKLQQMAEYHLGDHINVMQRGNLISQPITSSSSGSGGDFVAVGSGASTSAMMEDSNDPTASSATSTGIDIFNTEYRSVTGYPTDTPGIIFGTVAGMVGSILALDEFSYQFFLAIQSAMRKVFRPVEGFAHEDWRVFQNEHRTGTVKNVIDGDLVEQLLDMNLEELVAVTDEVNMELTIFMQNQANNANSGNAASNSSISSESTSALIAQLAVNKVRFAPEEILRRVEDIARLH